MSYGLLNIIFEKYIFDDQNEILNAKNDKIWIFKKLQFSLLIITQIYFVIWYDDALGLRALFILAQTSHRSSAHPPKIWFRVVTTTCLGFAQYFVRPPSFAMIVCITFGWLLMKTCQRAFCIAFWELSNARFQFNIVFLLFFISSETSSCQIENQSSQGSQSWERGG